MIDRQREKFPTLSTGNYLLSHSLGPVPRSAHDEMLNYLKEWEDQTSEDAWATHWWELSRQVGDRIARLLGGDPGTVQIQPSTTVAMYVVSSCFDFSKELRRKVVTTSLDFPSMGYLWEQQKPLGADVCVVASEDGIVVETERILEAIDEHTALVAMSYVSYRSSARVDVKAIVDRAHKAGAKVVLDVYQSVGVMEMNATDWGVDFMIGGAIKWLCGGPSCGYLYVHPDLISKLEPRFTGWIAHVRPFDFSHQGMEYDHSIRRFSQGTPNIPGMYSCLAGLKIIEDVGVHLIEEESRRRTQRMIEYALEQGWKLNSPQDVDLRGGSVMIYVDDPQVFVEKLAKRKIFVDCRPGVGLRISPHFFNTDDEVEELLCTLAELIG